MDITQIKESCGIYSLRIGTKEYIGSSKNIRTRLLEHTRQLKANKHHSFKAQLEYNTVGEINYDILELCKEGDLITREQFYLDTKSPELNIASKAGKLELSPQQVNDKQGGERNHRAKYTLEQIIKVVELRLTGMTYSKISEATSVNSGTVGRVCSGAAWKYELIKAIPDKYTTLIENKDILGRTNQASSGHKIRRFDISIVVEIVNKLLSRKYSLDDLAKEYSTNKTTISEIKQLKGTYTKDIISLYPELAEQLLALPEGQIKL